MLRLRNPWLPRALTVLLVACSCDSKPSGGPAEPQSSVAGRRDLTPETASVVLARVGERTITLGDYVSALERMDSFDRLRYQTPERRKLLLDEMIDVELLAQEAVRLGLDREPEGQAYLRQLMREEVLRRLRDEQPRAEDLPATEVRAYYDAHLQDFSDPERRRVAVILLGSEAAARGVLEQAQGADAVRWGELVRAHSSLYRPPTGVATGVPLEFEGDLGLTSLSDVRGHNPNIPKEVREAAFAIEPVQGVHPDVVRSGGKFYIVRLLSKSGARQRTLEEADSVIRVKLLQERIRGAEQALEEELRRKYPVHIDEKVIGALELPGPKAGRAPDVSAPPTATGVGSGP